MAKNLVFRLSHFPGCTTYDIFGIIILTGKSVNTAEEIFTKFHILFDNITMHTLTKLQIFDGEII